MWCIQTIDSEYRKRMYDVLDLYEEDYDPKRPIVCLDEKPKQLLADKRTSIPMKPGSPEKYDYEYIRNGTANIFVAIELKAEKILDKIEFHYTPKHASWLNAAEIEINVMDIECTDRRISDIEILTHEVGAWEKKRNELEKRIEWKFSRKNADEKMSKYCAQ